MRTGYKLNHMNNFKRLKVDPIAEDFEELFFIRHDRKDLLVNLLTETCKKIYLKEDFKMSDAIEVMKKKAEDINEFSFLLFVFARVYEDTGRKMNFISGILSQM